MLINHYNASLASLVSSWGKRLLLKDNVFNKDLGHNLRYYMLVENFCTKYVHAVFHCRSKSAKVTDKRVGVMNEIISGMRLIKMYAWEWAFHEYVKKIRKLA